VRGNFRVKESTADREANWKQGEGMILERKTRHLGVNAEEGSARIEREGGVFLGLGGL